MIAVQPDQREQGAAAHGGSNIPTPAAPGGDINLALVSADLFTSLARSGIRPSTLSRMLPIMTATGTATAKGCFDPAEAGEPWVVFHEQDDTVFWNPATDRTASLLCRAFALNEQLIDNAATYCFDANLNIFATVSDWLRADCDGIVVLDWNQAFDKLRHVPRIALAERLLPIYRRLMQPRRMPSLSVIPRERSAA